MNKLHIYLSHLEHNFTVLKGLIKPSTALIGVVKASAYGTDAVSIALCLEALGIDRLAVAYTAEGVALKKAGIKCPIMVFYPQHESLETLLEYNLEPVAYSVRILNKLQSLAVDNTLRPIPLHLKFNTGLNRLGFAPSIVEEIVSKSQSDYFNLISIYSHLAASEEQRPSQICETQIEKFLELKRKSKKIVSETVAFHLLNSSGIFNYSEHQHDAVRSGIALYGFANHPEWDAMLKPVSQLISTILQIVSVKKGETVGYNSGWVAQHDAQIATLPLGHADGIGRQFGLGKIQVSINGKKASIVGNVCMDMCMIDVTKIDCHEGDEVELFGFKNSAEKVAKSGDTISYELLSNVGQRVERIIHR